MDTYKGTKIVKAFKINAINRVGFDDTLTLVGGQYTVDVDPEYVLKHKPEVGGYYVLYQDGYESWSPADPFEKAYVKQDIHPPATEFTEEELKDNPILRYFHYAHLPDRLQSTSKPFCDLAATIIRTLPKNAERTVALRKLLEAKDCAVRTHV